MLKRIIAIFVGVMVVAYLDALASNQIDLKSPAAITGPVTAAETPDNEKPTCSLQNTPSAGDTIDRFDRIVYGGYVVRTLHKEVTMDDWPGAKSKWVEMSYVTVQRGKNLVAKFDANLVFPLGNSSEVGLLDLLNNGHKQLIVSQDIPRTGAQWVVDLSPHFKVVFDGRKYRVGREANDMTISDLDGDGIKEIMVPTTAFYGFEKWRLTTSDTPLPLIVFKYHRQQQEYLPANPEFKDCVLGNLEAAEHSGRIADQRFQLGRVMSVVLDYIFAGHEDCGWNFFEEVCTLPDKAQIKADMLKELNVHPVYRYLHRSGSRSKTRLSVDRQRD